MTHTQPTPAADKLRPSINQSLESATKRAIPRHPRSRGDWEAEGTGCFSAVGIPPCNKEVPGKAACPPAFPRDK